LAASHRRWAAELLHHWFHRLKPAQRFASNLAVDAELAARFAPDLAMLYTRPSDEFLTDPQTALAAVLLFDQVPRNIYRGTPQAFLFDPHARAITYGALERGFDAGLTRLEQQFLAMPLMHSESRADHLLSLQIYARLGPRYGWAFAQSHAQMVLRFGRYPHRNAVLGRTSTAAERRAVAQGFAW
jgi:uncharacterized protein (DUF924 family)